MSLLFPVRALCIALLLPKIVLAETQTDHAPALRHCCDDAALNSARDAEALVQRGHTAASLGNGGQRSSEARHMSCGLHAPIWVESEEILAPCPLKLNGARYAPARSLMPSFVRAERLDRPPVTSS